MACEDGSMTDGELEHLRYPTGRFEPPAEISQSQRELWIAELEALPSRLREATERLSDEQLDNPYRPGGWTVRQVVHHLPDSHLNSYTRFRLALTEDAPTIRTYHEELWAELPDARRGPIATSLALLEALHTRWTALLKSLTDEQFARTFVHPEWGGTRLDVALGQYAWHGRHHLAQIEGLRSRRGW